MIEPPIAEDVRRYRPGCREANLWSPVRISSVGGAAEDPVRNPGPADNLRIFRRYKIWGLTLTRSKADSKKYLRACVAGNSVRSCFNLHLRPVRGVPKTLTGDGVLIRLFTPTQDLVSARRERDRAFGEAQGGYRSTNDVSPDAIRTAPC